MKIRFIPIFVFHSIVENPSADDGFALSLRSFEKFIHFLYKKKYRTICMSEYEDWPRYQPYTVALTFDDGYANFVEVVTPILRRHGYSATLYPYLSFEKDSMWNGAVDGPHKLLSREQFHEAAALPFVEIGSHSLTHRTLTELSDEVVMDELDGSRKLLTKLTGKKISSLAYPRAIYDARIMKAAERCGYTNCVGGNTLSSSIHAIPRILPPLETSGMRMKIKMSGYNTFISKMSGRSDKF